MISEQCFGEGIAANALVVKGDQIFDVDQAYSFAKATGHSQVNILDGANIDVLKARKEAAVSIYGGEIGKLKTSGNNTINVFGGSISKIKARANSVLTLDNIDDLMNLESNYSPLSHQFSPLMPSVWQ